MVQKIIIFLFLTFFLSTVGYGNTILVAQQTSTQETQLKDDVPQVADDTTTVKTEVLDDEKGILSDNPFTIDDDDDGDIEDKEEETVTNPFLAAPTPDVEDDEDLESSLPFDLLADINIGMNFSKLFDIRPLDISAKGYGEYAFNAGILLLMQNTLYGKIGIRSMRNRFETSFLQVSTKNDTALTSSRETFNFLTLPINFGKRFSLFNVIPYVQLNVEPALLTFSSQISYVRNVTMFQKKAILITNTISDSTTTKVQARYQLFAGLSGGIEMSYGYGSVYLETGLMYMAIEPSIKMAKPKRTQNKLLYIPFALGMRFYI